MSVKYLSETRGEVQRDSTTFQEAAGMATWGGVGGNLADQTDLQAALLTAGVGLNQTWQDKLSPTVDRVKNVEYTNTTGRVIWVSVTMSNGDSNDSEFLIDGHVVSSVGGAGLAVLIGTMLVPVPAGSTYKVSSIHSIKDWWEYR